MPMGEAPRDFERLGSRKENLSLQRPAYYFDDMGWEMREVSQGLMLDLPLIPECPAKEVIGVGLPVGSLCDLGYVHCAIFS